MKLLYKALFLIISLAPFAGFAQTDTVQTFTFKDSTRRSGKFLFPPANIKYRKILMYHTLKCYPKVSAYDKKYPCGEWDYLTYTFVTDTSGKAIEIGRYITPYGINLTLGPNGFTWVYDVTDYRAYLADSVQLSSGNTQELLDLKFVFFEGEAPADVIKVDQLWNNGAASYSYADLTADKKLFPISAAVDPNAGVLKFRSRMTGHGHNSNDGSYPHCCEWKNNTHYLYSDSTLVNDWELWQTLDCADNPVFPQGGTWPYAREGWCPGDRVKDVEFDITRFRMADSIHLDYRITPVPANNLGMGGGNYVTANHLIQYAKPKYWNDAEIYDILSPSSAQINSKFNPVCAEPRIVIRNNSLDTMRTLDLEYLVSGGQKMKYTWTGKLGFLQTEVVALPIRDGGFYRGDGSNVFTCKITRRNLIKDEYAANNTMQSNFKLPDIYKDRLYIEFKSNTNPDENRYVIRDAHDSVVFVRENLAANKVYKDTLYKLKPGCYTLELTDEGTDGLSFWANAAQGSGYIRLRKATGNTVLKNFGPDFGYRIYYAFIADSLQKENSTEETDIKGDETITLYPNPGNGALNIETYGFMGNYTVTIYSSIGDMVYENTFNTTENPTIELNNLNVASGIYVVKLSNGTNTLIKKWMAE